MYIYIINYVSYIDLKTNVLISLLIFFLASAMKSNGFSLLSSSQPLDTHLFRRSGGFLQCDSFSYKRTDWLLEELSASSQHNVRPVVVSQGSKRD